MTGARGRVDVDHGGAGLGVVENAARAMLLTVAVPAEVVEAITAEVVRRVLEQLQAPAVSPFMTIPEAAEFLRCSRQRVDDLLSQRRLTRMKEGSRTLVSRQELLDHVAGVLPPARPSRQKTGVER